MATLKQTIANRLNALRSTGPRSAEGKANSSRNALKHGLSRIGLTPPGGMADAIADRLERWRDDYRPEGSAQEWLFERLCAESVRLDSCERRILAARAERADRALESWDDDRAAEVAELGSRLSTRPEAIQPKLLQTKHGVLWLIERWDEVADSLRRCRGWAPETWDRAMDLLGLSPLARQGSGPWDLDPEDPSEAPGLDLVRRSVEALRERLANVLEDRDDRTRALAELGLGPDADHAPELRLLERYALDARRRFSWCVQELRRLQASPGASAADRASSRDPSTAPDSHPARPVRPPRPRPGGMTTEVPTTSSGNSSLDVDPPASITRPVESPPMHRTEPDLDQASTRPMVSLPGRSFSENLRDRLSPSPFANRRARRAASSVSRRG
jgi:hypothetical protein